MTDFKAPPPPGGFVQVPTPPAAPTPQPKPAVNPVPTGMPEAPVESPASAPNTTSEQNQTAEKMNATFDKLQEQKEKVVNKFNALPTNKRQVIIAAGIFVIGLLMGAIMFGGSDEAPAQAPKGLQGIVSNPDIKEPLKRCGQVEASAPCVLYVMNNYTYEKLAQDFFELAVSVTGRKDRVIRMDNVRYGTIRIPPGYFAQIKIPAYK